MARADNLYALPAGLPAPVDDGGASHLEGMAMPPVKLPSTAGRIVDVSELRGRTVLYCYPRTGRPDKDPPPGWDEIPGARGCTPQACSFRDHYQELKSVGARVFGLSTQDPDYQREAAVRLHLPFELLSDARLELTNALRLPVFQFEGVTLMRRLTLLLRDADIEKVFYPVFPPDQSADEVLDWLRNHGRAVL